MILNFFVVNIKIDWSNCACLCDEISKFPTLFLVILIVRFTIFSKKRKTNSTYVRNSGLSRLSLKLLSTIIYLKWLELLAKYQRFTNWGWLLRGHLYSLRLGIWEYKCPPIQRNRPTTSPTAESKMREKVKFFLKECASYPSI